ncbi:hypothetical protein [Pseudaestuariivita rosea]|nr:hypothetical protein [Pseudaestuariivita rosea]
MTWLWRIFGRFYRRLAHRYRRRADGFEAKSEKFFRRVKGRGE